VGIVTLTTDFGLADGYVGTMKGVILSIAPCTAIVDISHEISPQDVLGGAFVLGSAYPYFPNGTVHVAVVDPGVGSERRAVAVGSQEGFFIAPDNGLLTFVLADHGCLADLGGCSRPHHLPEGEGIGTPLEGVQKQWLRPDGASGQFPLQMVPLPEGLTAVVLTESRFWLPDVSATFHGRDIFSPVGAHLSRGVRLEELGRSVDTLHVFALPRPERQSNGSLLVTVIHVDGFGNAITNAKQGDIPYRQFEVEAGGLVMPLGAAYAAGEDFLVLFGSTGRLEVAKRNGNAAAEMGLRVGSTLIVRPLARGGEQ